MNYCYSLLFHHMGFPTGFIYIAGLCLRLCIFKTAKNWLKKEANSIK